MSLKAKWALVTSIVCVVIISSSMAISSVSAAMSPSISLTKAQENSGVSDNGTLSYSMNGSNLSLGSVNSSADWSSFGSILTQRISNLSIPSEAKLLPNFDRAPRSENGTYLPSYTSAPAPMGVASYGVLNESGTLTPYSYKTSSFEGSLTITSAQELYLSSDAPQSFGVQLNAVLNNVTLFGKSGYQYWTQNVVEYSVSTHSLTFIDYIWNFSSSTAVINGNEFHSYNGTPVPGVFYYSIGNTFTITAPFTLDLYLNTTSMGGYNTVFFNYSLSSTSQKEKSGSYDEVQFNSPSSSGAVSPTSYFEVSNSLTNTGYIPMDAELVIGGAGGGSNANFYNVSATMNLDYWNGTSGYSPVRSAYDVGSETGETAVGISEYFTGQTAHLSTGPSLVSGLWGISHNQGFYTLSGTISPSNSFVFINTGSSVDNATAQWAPFGIDGSFDFRLMPGNYSMEVQLSYHDPFFKNGITLNSNQTLSVPSLVFDISQGLYTPLYAMNNGQLAALSVAGTGSQTSPYVIPGEQYYVSKGESVPTQLASVFTQVNDYMYPVFSGILVNGTSDYANFTGFQNTGEEPAFHIQYSSTMLQTLTEYFEEPLSNYLQLEFYNSSNIMVNDSVISGWFSYLVYNNFTAENVPPVASLMFWNVTSSLIEHNIIESQGSGVLIYNQGSKDSGNIVWNNTFGNYPNIDAGSYFGGAPIGLTVESSGNTVYNNIFRTTIPVVSLDGVGANIYTGGNVSYHNKFNVTKESAGSVLTIDGVSLSGSILNLTYQAGNFYYNYFGDGTSAYNGSGVGFIFNGQNTFNGSINYGFDYRPLTLNNYTTNISAIGLPFGQGTFLDIDNAIYGVSFGSSTTLYLPNGTHYVTGFLLLNPQVEFIPIVELGTLALSSGYFTVSGPLMNLTLVYTEYFNVTVTEAGLPANAVWGFAIPQAGVGYFASGTSVSTFLSTGSYDIVPQSVDGYYAATVSVSVTAPTQVTLTYENITSVIAGSYTVIFTENGLPAGTSWGVKIGNQEFTDKNSSFAVTGFQTGTYDYTVVSVNGYSSVPSGSIVINGGNSSVSITFVRSGGISTTAYLYIGLGTAAGLIAGGLVTFFRFRRKSI